MFMLVMLAILSDLAKFAKYGTSLLLRQQDELALAEFSQTVIATVGRFVIARMLD
jgi:hypothetical protein